MTKPIPTILITGFLGAGKTTFINQILRDHPDKKISLILNEFGDIKLESKFIEVKGVGLVSELSGGCLCCVANVDLPRVIRYTLEQASATEYLIIEASGLSDPDPVRLTLTSPNLSAEIRLDTVVAIVDADNFERSFIAHPLVLSQIAEADYALLSKTENHPKAAVDKLLNSVSSIGLGTKTFIWDSHFDTNLIFDPPISPHVKKAELNHHVHSKYDQYSYLSNESHDLTKLTKIITDLPENILRLKGYSGSYLLQKVGKRVDIRRVNEQGSDYQTAILIIGTDLEKPFLRQMFASASHSQ